MALELRGSKAGNVGRRKNIFKHQRRAKSLYSVRLPADFVAYGVLQEEFVVVSDPDACAKLFHHGCFGTFRKRPSLKGDGRKFDEYFECLLSAEETLYLSTELKQLVCRFAGDESKTLNEAEIRQHFQQFFGSIDEKFLIYSYWRKQNCVVRNGFKFGVDYSVYPNHPDIAHARYAVKILYNRNARNEVQVRDLKSLARVAGQVSKDLVFCMVENQPVNASDNPAESSSPNILVSSWGRFSFKH